MSQTAIDYVATFTALVRQAQQKEKLLGGTSQVGLTDTIRGLDVLVFCALAPYARYKEFEAILGNQKSCNLKELLYAKQETVGIHKLAREIEHCAGNDGLRDVVFHQINRWLEVYLVTLDTLVPIHQFAKKADFAFYGDTAHPGIVKLTLKDLYLGLQWNQPHRFASIVNDMLSKSDSRERYTTTGFNPTALPAMKLVVDSQFDFWTTWLNHAQKSIKAFRPIIETPAPRQRQRYSRRR